MTTTGPLEDGLVPGLGQGPDPMTATDVGADHTLLLTDEEETTEIDLDRQPGDGTETTIVVTEIGTGVTLPGDPTGDVMTVKIAVTE